MFRLNLLVLRCHDIEKSKPFYECFGMRFEKHSHGNGPEHYAAEDEAGVLELYPVGSSSVADGIGLGFDEPDLESMFRRLVDLGFAPQAIRENPWGKTFVIRDPDGRRVEVKEATTRN